MEQKRLLSAMDQTRTTMTSYLEFDELDCGTTPSNTTYYKDKNYMTRTGTEPEIRAVNRCALACSEMAATDCGGFVFVKNDAGAEIDGNSMYPQFACKFRSEYKNSPEAGAGKCDSNSDLRFYQRTAGFITGS
ncbi:unnamed protein product [Amoebophrya sp. A25]|nr:unnamed protein product [Amoebophrya sp. A25]|eukprot:GSA25T00014990001.1